jgi:hypothetical protein
MMIMPVFANKNSAKNVGSEPFLFIIRYMIACFNYLNRRSVAETILVMDNGGHCDAILNELRFVFEKFKGLAQPTPRCKKSACQGIFHLYSSEYNNFGFWRFPGDMVPVSKTHVPSVEITFEW